MKLLHTISGILRHSCKKYKLKLPPSKYFSTEATPPSLTQILQQKIKISGPLTLAKFMNEVLTHPTQGYYTTKNEVFGKQGDFVTSPEISQLFGELIAVWLINEWGRVGAKKPFNLVELGPGRGTMLRDMIKVFRQFKVYKFMSIHLVEVSDVLSNIQAEKLNVKIDPPSDKKTKYYKSGETEDGIKVYWYRSLADYKYLTYSLIVAHEFFDAMPIHKFQKTEIGWREILVDIDESGTSEKKFKYVLSKDITIMCKLLIRPDETREHVEISSDSILYMGCLARDMEAFGGAGLIIDYGHDGTKTDTFRAFRNHEQCDPLCNIGDADLTADVDFSILRSAANPRLITYGPVTQRQFLKQMHIDTRLKVLLENCKDEKLKKNLTDGYNMLVDEDKMGSLFKFMSFFPSVLEKPFQQYPVVGFLEENK